MSESDEYQPSEDEITEVLDQYQQWLHDGYDQLQDKEEAIDKATNLALNHEESGKVFFWIIQNDSSLIYDKDDTIKE